MYCEICGAKEAELCNAFDSQLGKCPRVKPLDLNDWRGPNSTIIHGGPIDPSYDVKTPPTTGVKADTGKDPWHLVPFDAVKAVVQVLAFGANKYAPRNWEKGMDWSRVYSALLRHLFAWWGGEGKDPETGFSHLWHAACCIMFLVAYEIRGIGKDDRPIKPDKEAEALAQAA